MVSLRRNRGPGKASVPEAEASQACSTRQTNSDPSGAAPVGAYLAAGQKRSTAGNLNSGGIMAVRDTTLKIIAEHLGLNASEISDDSTFDADLGADSLDQVEIVIALEEEFTLEIEDADADQADTVGKLIALVERLVAE